MISFSDAVIPDTGSANSCFVGATSTESACRNLQAPEDGPRQLTGEIERMISRLARTPRLEAHSSSLYHPTQTDVPARRSPSGARRRAWQKKAQYQRTRCPERLRPWQIEGLFEADHFARVIGLPLNTFVTVSWKNTRDGGEDIQRRFQAATKAMGQWLRRRNCPAAWIFTHENPGGSEPNFHMLIHIPPGSLVAFREIGSQWFGAVSGGIHIRTRNGPRDRCLSYMVKGTDLMTARRYGARAKKQGTVTFKRCGWTESLGVKARTRHSELIKGGLATGFR